MHVPDEVRLRMAEADLFASVAAIVARYEIPQSLISLMMKSVLLDITEGELRAVSSNGFAMAQELTKANAVERGA